MRTSRAALVPLLLLLAACSTDQRPRDPHTIAPTTTDKGLAGRTTLAMPITIAGQPTLIIPFAIESDKDVFQMRDPFRSGGMSAPAASYAAMPDAASVSRYVPIGGGSVRWHNAILRDTRSSEEWAILDKRGIISSWSVMGTNTPSSRPGESTFVAAALVFLATLEDTNHDGLLNDLDARVAILTDADGRHPRIISPEAAQVWSVSFDAQSSTVFLMVVADTNHDGLFDFNDAPVPYSMDARGAAATVVSAEMLRRVEGLLK
jgi:hypothetical protein